MKPRKGLIVAGKYRLENLLGEGSQGQVWEAVHAQMGTPMAIKLLDPKLAADKDYLRRFKTEARAAATIRSANVVQVFDFDVWEGSPFIAMELLEGMDLSVTLEKEGKLPIGQVALIVSQVARALSRAHRQKIIHRDLKPENIFLVQPDDEEEEQIVKILDFGVAKAPVGDSMALTGTGIVLGTPYYMSPEQAQGDAGISFATDLWALGVIAFEAIVGRRPFEATNLGDLLVKICATEPPVPSEIDPTVPKGFDAWFAQACAKNPKDRFSSAKEMASALNIVAGKAPGNMLESSLVELPTAAALRSGASLDSYGDLGSEETEIAPPPTVREPPRFEESESDPRELLVGGTERQDSIEETTALGGEGFEDEPSSEGEPTEVMADVAEVMAQFGDVLKTAEPVETEQQQASEVDDIGTAETLQDDSERRRAVEKVITTQSVSTEDDIKVFTTAQVQEELRRAKRKEKERRLRHVGKFAAPMIGGALVGMLVMLLLYYFGSH